jgi:hypothetical protein
MSICRGSSPRCIVLTGWWRLGLGSLGWDWGQSARIIQVGRFEYGITAYSFPSLMKIERLLDMMKS